MRVLLLGMDAIVTRRPGQTALSASAAHPQESFHRLRASSPRATQGRQPLATPSFHALMALCQTCGLLEFASDGVARTTSALSRVPGNRDGHFALRVQ